MLGFAVSLKEFLGHWGADNSRVPDHCWLTKTRAGLPRRRATRRSSTWVLALGSEIRVWSRASVVERL